jgi:hypothetical protein
MSKTYLNPNSGATKRNQRPLIPAGTRWANVVVPVVFDNRGEPAARHLAEKKGRRLALQEWEKEFGEIPWDMVRWNITHLTMQCVVEVLVEPV